MAGKRSGAGPWAAVVLIVLGAALVRAPLLSIPLDRDEGGYAYGAQRILDGGATYVDFYTMRYPAIFGAYAVLMRVFGESAWGIHAGLLAVNALTGIFLFLAARHWLGAWAGVAALTVFMTMSLNGTTEGFSANSEQFVILFACAGLWLLSRDDARGEWRAWIGVAGAGTCMGLAYLMKQHGIVFAAFGVVAILCREGDRRTIVMRCAAYTLVAAIVVGLSWLHLALTGRFEAFWFWTVEYARTYAGGVALRDGARIVVERAREVAPPLIPILALAGVGIYEVVRYRSRRTTLMLLMLLLLSVAGVSIGLYFRPHYFRLLFPALALLAGAGAVQCGRLAHEAPWRKLVPVTAVTIACGFLLVHQRALLFADAPAEASRRISGMNPFPESQAIAAYLRERTEPSDRVFVFGSEPQIYFYADRLAATPHIYMYQLMEPHAHAVEMQRQMIADVESARPAFVVSVDLPTSWLVRPTSETLLFEWFDAFMRDRYEIAWRLEFVLRDEVAYVRNVWEDNARQQPPSEPYFITIYRRLDDGRE